MDQTFLLEEITSLFFVPDRFFSCFLRRFLSELPSNLEICCLADPFGLRTRPKYLMSFIEVTHCIEQGLFWFLFFVH